MGSSKADVVVVFSIRKSDVGQPMLGYPSLRSPQKPVEVFAQTHGLVEGADNLERFSSKERAPQIWAMPRSFDGVDFSITNFEHLNHAPHDPHFSMSVQIGGMQARLFATLHAWNHKRQDRERANHAVGKIGMQKHQTLARFEVFIPALQPFFQVRESGQHVAFDFGGAEPREGSRFRFQAPAPPTNGANRGGGGRVGSRRIAAEWIFGVQMPVHTTEEPFE